MWYTENSDLPELRSGVYRHYKGELYQVSGYSHNATNGLNNQIEVDYVGLELNPAKPGPRPAHRAWREFFATVCTTHLNAEGGAVDAYSKEHEEIAKREGPCNPDLWQERFQYLGPIYLKGMGS